MSTKFALLALVGALTACGGGGSGGGDFAPSATTSVAPTTAALPEKTAEPAKKAGCYVVIYGDSLIADPLLSETIPASLARQRPGWTIDNRAVGGQTGRQGATDLFSDPRPQGAVVVEEWGVNDLILQDNPLPAMRAFTSKIFSEGSTAVITGVIQHPQSGDLWNNYNLGLLSIATDLHAAFVSWGEVPITTFDGTHPDQASTNVLVEDLLNSLDKECDDK